MLPEVEASSLVAGVKPLEDACPNGSNVVEVARHKEAPLHELHLP